MLTHQKPHSARANVKQWACHGAKKKIKIEVITQPPQSPDLNVNELVAKETAIELKEAVENCWQEYPADRMPAVWNCLFASFKGIVESNGDNSYSHPTGSRHAHHISAEEGEHHDRRFPVQNIKEAEKSLEFLRNEVTQTQNAESMQLRAHQTTMSELNPKFVHNLKSIFQPVHTC